MSEDNNKKKENSGDDKNHLIMVIVAVVVIVLFAKFVTPAMDKGTKPPSSILTGEEYDR